MHLRVFAQRTQLWRGNEQGMGSGWHWLVGDSSRDSDLGLKFESKVQIQLRDCTSAVCHTKRTICSEIPEHEYETPATNPSSIVSPCVT